MKNPMASANNENLAETKKYLSEDFGARSLVIQTKKMSKGATPIVARVDSHPNPNLKTR